MSRKTIIIAVLVAAVVITFLFLPVGMSLIIRDKAGHVYFEESVTTGDIVSKEFTHSVEKVQVVDTLLVTADGTSVIDKYNIRFSWMGPAIRRII